jgi:hypothetical protein
MNASSPMPEHEIAQGAGAARFCETMPPRFRRSMPDREMPSDRAADEFSLT